MKPLASRLFARDPLLHAVAAGRERLSWCRHAHDPVVGRVQIVLLRWDPGCLPEYGADGMYGTETAAAVSRFLAEAVETSPTAFDGEVDARAIRELDRVQQAYELSVDETARITELDRWLTIPIAGRPVTVTTSGVHTHITAEHARAAFDDAVTGCTEAGGFVVDTAWIPASLHATHGGAWRLDVRWAYDGARLRAFCGAGGQLEVIGPAADPLYAETRSGTELPPVPATRGGAFLQRTRVFRDETERTGFLLYAIARAKQFIYVEDPPCDEVIARQLAARMNALEALILVLPKTSGRDELLRARRRRFLNQLAPFLSKVAVVESSCDRPPAGWWIFDDYVAAAGPIAFSDILEPGAVVNLRTALWNSRLGRFAPAANARPAATVSLWRAYAQGG